MFPKEYLVRVKDTRGELHTVISYGQTQEEAKERGKRIAKKLLKEPIEFLWIKPYTKKVVRR
jgi:hypothetical protein